MNGGTLDASGTGAVNYSNSGSIAFSGTGVRTLTLAGSNTDNNILCARITDAPSSNATSLAKTDGATWILTNNNSFTGTTIISGGKLLINGSLASGSAVTVDNGGTLGGTGMVSGTVNVAGGGTIAPGSGGAATLSTGALTLNNSSVLSFDLGTNRDSIKVNGDLTLDGSLDVNELAGFGVGTYYLIKYTGTLTNNAISFGTLPNGYSYTLNAGGGYVTLTVSSGYYWDISATAGFQPGNGIWGTNNYWSKNGTHLGPGQGPVTPLHLPAVTAPIP